MMATRRDFGGLLMAGVTTAALPAARDRPFILEGRLAELKDRLRAGFPGVTLHAKWQGPRLLLHTAGTSDTVYLDIIVDEGAPRTVRLSRERQVVEVYSGPGGAHHVEIRRRGESWQGQWDLFDVEAPDGRWLAPPILPARKLMFIGDSITCGEAADVRREEIHNDIALANAYLSFGKVLARHLNAQCHLIAAGGRGLMRDWEGINDDTTAPRFYERASLDEALNWDHRRYVPDAIGICLGTNDFSSGIPDERVFISTLVAFVEKVRRDAPNAGIVLIDSPILTDEGTPKRSALRAYLDGAARRLADPRVVRAAVAHYPGRPVNAHPVAEEHAAIAQELEPAFSRLLA
jgi:lysophospholipase L1-like esterase